LIELKQFEKAMEKCLEVIKVFDEEQVDFKVRARILQRKGTIHTSLKQFKEAVEAYEASLFECKNDAVKDLLIEAKRKLRNWEIEQNTDPEKSDQCNKEGNELWKNKQ